MSTSLELAVAIVEKLDLDDAARKKLLQLHSSGELNKIFNAHPIGEEGWLGRTWRPLLMILFGVLIAARWFGWSNPGLAEAEYIKLWDIVQLGLGGYVIGRSVEKVAPQITEAIVSKNERKS